MSIIVKHILRNIRSNLLAAVVVVLSLSLASALFYISFHVQRDLDNISLSLYPDIYGGYELFVMTDAGFPPVSAPEFDGCSFLPVFSQLCRVSERSGTEEGLLLYADFEELLTRGLLILRAGELPTGQGTVAVSEEKAAALGLQIGDTLYLNRRNARLKHLFAEWFPTLGLSDAADDSDPVTEAGENSREGSGSTLLQRLTRGDEYVITAVFSCPLLPVQDDYLELLCAYDTKLSPQLLLIDTNEQGRRAEALRAEQLVNLLKAKGWSAAVLDKGSVSEDLQNFRYVLYLLVALTVLLGCCVIASVTKQTTEARLSALGTLRSVGAARGTLFGLSMLENGIYGLLGGLLGLLFGEILRRVIASVYYHVEGLAFPFSPLYLVLTLLFALLLQLGTAALTLLRSDRLSVKELILQKADTAEGQSTALFPAGLILILLALALRLLNRRYYFAVNAAALAAALSGCLMITPRLLKLCSRLCAAAALRLRRGPLFLACRQLTAARSAVSGTVLIAAATALMVLISFIVSSVGFYFAEYSRKYTNELFIKWFSGPFEAYSFLRDVEGVAEINAEYWDCRDILINDTSRHVCLVRPHGYPCGIDAAPGAEDALQQGEVLIDRLFAVRLGVAEGDVLRISDNNYSSPYTLTVAGYISSGAFNPGSSTLLLCEEDYDTYVEAIPALIGVRLEAGADEAAVRQRLYDAFSEQSYDRVTVYSRAEYLSEEYGSIQSAFSVASCLPVFAALLAVFGIANQQLSVFRTKRREYAVLYSVSMSRRQISRMVFLEILLVFPVGSLYGLLISFWLTRIVRDIVFSLLVYLEISYDLVLLGKLLLCSFALLLLASLIPQYRAGRIHIIEEIRYE